MAQFFINRPIVAMVISIITVIAGAVTILALPTALFPNIAPPEIQVKAIYTGADALTIEQSVATPIEQQMSGVDNLNYMYSINSNTGLMTLTTNFDIKTDPNTDQILSQMRQSQAASQMPPEVNAAGITVVKSNSAPLMLFDVYSPDGRYDAEFLANYAYININDQLTRVRGIASVTVFGAGQYAMRIWVRPDQLAKLQITIPEVINALKQQNTVNPAGQIGAEPVPPGQDFTYAVRALGRLVTEEDFGNVVIRADADGSMIRVRDVGRVELGAQTYNIFGRLNGKPSAIVAVYQLPGSNAVQAAKDARKLMDELRTRFPPGLECAVALDTTLAVIEGVNEIIKTLVEALVLVIIVVFVFLQGWRATLIPLLAVPVSLVGTFLLFPLFGFSVNTLSLFGLVLAIGLVVDDAIVVVEAVEHHIEHGLSPKEATVKAMQEVTGPVIGIALVLSAVFIPTAFIPGITGRLYQQFAVTIAISVILSAFNALTLSPALSALLLRPKKQGRGPLALFFKGFNKVFGWITGGYVGACRGLIRVHLVSMLILVGFVAASGWLGGRLPSAFLPDEDQGYFYVGVQLPDAASLQRTAAVATQIEKILAETPGVEYTTTIGGYNMLSGVQNTFSSFFFVTLKEWGERKAPNEKYAAIMAHVNAELRKLPQGIAFAFSPPAIPGVGAAGGFTFVLQDRSGGDIKFLDDQLKTFMAAASKRPEIAGLRTTFLPAAPQVYAEVDRDKVLKQNVELTDVYKTLQTFMGGYMVNFFNRFGRQWQVYVQADGEYRTQAEDAGRFFVKNKNDEMVPLSTLTRFDKASGPEFTMRYNLYRCAQLNGGAAPGFSSAQAMKALEEVFDETMPREMGYGYMGMSFQEKVAQQGVPPTVIFGFSLLFVFLILAAMYESWSLPFSVLLTVPVAVFGAFGGLLLFKMENNIFAQIGLVMLIGLAAKNAILIVEFAKLEFEKGKPLIDATLEGAKLRLRPILMTSFAFILGCVPLVLATGAGAVARNVMGVCVIAGMLAATVIGIFLVPPSYYFVMRITGAKPGSAAPPPSPSASPPGAAQAGGAH
ncbi:MAG: efflux RND transporter permease subunit [Phycisphaerales bacterium]